MNEIATNLSNNIPKIITKIRYHLVKIILNTSLDSSGGFRCYAISKIKKKDILLADNNGYFFLIESLFYLERMNYKIIETNIKQIDSKLNKNNEIYFIAEVLIRDNKDSYDYIDINYIYECNYLTTK